MGRIREAENMMLDALPPNRMSARTERQVAAEMMCDNVIIAGHLLGGQRDLMRPIPIYRSFAELAFAIHHSTHRVGCRPRSTLLAGGGERSRSLRAASGGVY